MIITVHGAWCSAMRTSARVVFCYRGVAAHHEQICAEPGPAPAARGFMACE